MPELKTLFPVLDSLIYSGEIPVDHSLKLFNIQNLAEAEVKSDKVINLDNVGPQRLPFRETWFEYELERESSRPLRFGAYFTEEPSEDFSRIYPDPSVSVVLESHLYVLEGLERLKVHSDFRHIIAVTEQGRIVDTPAFNFSERSNILKRPRDEKEIQRLSTLQVSVLRPMYLAIGLINCKNIETPIRGTNPTSSKKDRKKRRPAYEYRVIQLPQPRYESGGGGSGESSGSTRLHAVRGHFKTYTAEKPLYGKLTGTWWWADHARGNIENGQVISNYEVGKRN